MRSVYTGLLVGFGMSCWKLSGAHHGRFILPLSVFMLAFAVAAGRE